MSAIEKLAKIVSSLAADATAEDIANKIKSRKKADLKVIAFDAMSATIATDEGDTIQIVSKSDTSFTQFMTFLKRKSSVLLPKVELVQEVESFGFYKSEPLTPLATAIGDSNELFANWLGRYAEARKTGRAVRGTKDEAAPAAITGMVHVGNLRGLVNKLVQSNTDGVQMDFTNFSVRDTAEGKQIVVNNPFKA